MSFKKWAIGLMAGVMVFAAGCGSSGGGGTGSGDGTGSAGGDSGGATKEVEIAIVGPMTGDFAVVGQQFKEGAELAFDAVNEAGGVNGVTFKIVTYDDRGDSTEATNVARRIAGNNNVLAVIGHYTSGPVFAAQGIYD